jgi:hypothetical protein
LTKASSKSRSSVSASSSGTVPVATVRPWATTTTLSQRRSTSCMMWVEKTMHLAPPSGERSQRRLSRKARVARTSRPLVGSSRTMLAGSWTSARTSAVFIRSPWLKPAARRSSSAVMSNMRARSCARASAASRSMPCSAP